MVTSSPPSSISFDTSQIPAQREFMESTHPELLFSGAFGASKSRSGCEKGFFLSLKYPGNRGLITRKKYTDLRDTTQDTFFRYVVPEEHKKDWFKQEHKLVLKNGSEILFIGIDQPTKIGSLEVGWIFIDEIIEFTEADYNMLLGRLRHPVPFHQIFGATNPADPQHWVHKRFYDNQELIRDGTVKLVESNALQNPFTPESYKTRLKTFRGRYYERYVEGKWIGFEGLVYDNWNPATHLLPRDSKRLGLTGDGWNPIPEDWERFRSVDFGFTNPFVCHWWASPRFEYIGEPGRQDRVEIPFPDRIWVMYREIYYSGRPVDDHAKKIVRLSSQEKVRTTFADWDAGDRAIMEREGIPTVKAEKEVSTGIQSVYDAIGSGRVYILEDSLVEEDPELILNNLPTHTAAEFSGYQRAQGREGKYNPKEEPQKRNDHGMDTLRYLIYSLEKAHRPSGTVHVSTKSGLPIGTSKTTPKGIMSSGNRNWGAGSERKWRRFS